MERLKIGLVIADNDEYKPLEDYISTFKFETLKILGRNGHCFKIGEKEIISVCCGTGKVNAAAAAVKLIDLGCNLIFNFGLSGGVSGVCKSDFVAPDRFVEHDFDLTGLGYKQCEKPGQKYIYEADKHLLEIINKLFPFVKSGTAVSGDRFICSETERLNLKQALGATSCDMETAAIAYVCYASDVPFASLRKISDDAGADAISSYRDMNKLNENCLVNMFLKIVEGLV